MRRPSNKVKRKLVMMIILIQKEKHEVNDVHIAKKKYSNDFDDDKRIMVIVMFTVNFLNLPFRYYHYHNRNDNNRDQLNTLIRLKIDIKK